MIDYSDSIFSLAKFDGSVMPEAFLQSLGGLVFAVALCIFYQVFPEMREKSFWAGFNIDSFTWTAMTACIGILIGLRIKQALGRFWEGTSLLHQMRGEWFDAASCLVTFSRDAKLNKSKEIEVAEFQGTLVRLMSLMHGSALDEISDLGVCFEVIDINGLDASTLIFLKTCQEKYNCSKVEALQHLIQVLVTENHHAGVLTIPPPILSRVYQTLSRGLVNLLNARKITDTKFPFPFVQTIKLSLFVQAFVTPLIMTTVYGNFSAVLFTFIPLFGLHCLNLTAWQLEMPFGGDPNDLPLAQFQDDMNSCLMMLVAEGADRCPKTSVDALSLKFLTGDEGIAAMKSENKPEMSVSIGLQGVLSGHKRASCVGTSRRPSGNSCVSGVSSAYTHSVSNTKSIFDKDFIEKLERKTLKHNGSSNSLPWSEVLSQQTINSSFKNPAPDKLKSGSDLHASYGSDRSSDDVLRQLSPSSLAAYASRQLSPDSPRSPGKAEGRSPKTVQIVTVVDPPAQNGRLSSVCEQRSDATTNGERMNSWPEKPLIRLGEQGFDRQKVDLNDSQEVELNLHGQVSPAQASPTPSRNQLPLKLPRPRDRVS